MGDGLNYDYTDARRYCEAYKLAVDVDDLSWADYTFRDAGLSQAQVDAVMRAHVWHVAHLFGPANYGWRARIALALHFLFGGK